MQLGTSGEPVENGKARSLGVVAGGRTTCSKSTHSCDCSFTTYNTFGPKLGDFYAAKYHFGVGKESYTGPIRMLGIFSTKIKKYSPNF